MDSPTLRVDWFSTIVFALAALLGTVDAGACKPGQASTSGVIQLVGSNCMPSGMFGSYYAGYMMISINNVRSLCGAAFKVDVNKQGFMYMTPLEQGEFKWAGPELGATGTFKCSNLNATGRFDASNPTIASVMFYDDVGGPHSRLEVTGPNKLTLATAHNVVEKAGSDPPCFFQYTVVSGCVMGIPAPAKPFICPSGWYIKSGRYGRQYCALCPVSASSRGPNAKKCDVCSSGTVQQSSGNCQSCDLPRQYTGRTTCKTCPPDSWAHPRSPSQCVACTDKGVRCCRNNHNKSCPPCKPGFKSGNGAPPATFVLTSASHPACLRTRPALCAMSFNVTVLSSCKVQVQSSSPRMKFTVCGYSAFGSGSVRGLKASLTDIALVGATSKPIIIKGPSASFTFRKTPGDRLWPSPAPNTCTFTYRSVTASASLLGVPPAPCSPGNPGCVSKTSRKCPAGQFVQHNIDGNTLCVPCPPGTFNPSPTTSTKCTLCPAGQYFDGYGSTKCTPCPSGTFSSTAGTTMSCTSCQRFSTNGGYSDSPGSSRCKACPPGSAPVSTPESYYGDPLSVNYITKCLGRSKGKMCCAAGDCSGQPACPKALRALERTDSAIFQLQSAQLSDPSCSGATFLTCLSPNASIIGRGLDKLNFEIKSVDHPGCVMTPFYGGGGEDLRTQVNGGYTATNQAWFKEYLYDLSKDPILYRAISNATAGTMTMYLPTSSVPDSVVPPAVKCWATFKLLAGHAFDLSPPSDSCPDGTILVKQDGAVFCRVCGDGRVLKNGPSRSCQLCPQGTYQPRRGLGTKCLTCPPGTLGQLSDLGATVCRMCYPGSVPGAPKKPCNQCPANTYALPGFARCKACPAGTVAPKGSSVCGVPFPK